MKIEFPLTFDLYRAAHALFQRRQLSMRLMFPSCVALLAAGILGAMFIDERGPYGWLSAVSAGAIGGGFMGAIVMPLVRVYLVRRAYRGFLPSPVDNRVLSYEIDHDRIGSQVPGVGFGTIKWSAICDFAQNDKVTLLYLTKRRFYFFPTGAMTKDQRTELNDLVARYLPKRKL
jgi:hypothetical protein